MNVRSHVGIVAIVKDEAPYLAEWLDHHRAIGFDRFLIADNGSSDGSFELLSSQAKNRGDIDLISFVPEIGVPPQLPAYRELVKQFSSEIQWLAFIDADEFVALDNGGSIGDFLSQFDESDVGAIAVNWACFGSGGLETYDDRPVTKRFRLRAEREFIANYHYKSIVRKSAFEGTRGTPHHFGINPAFRYVQVDGRSLLFHPQRGEGLSEEVVWSPVRINHYAVKSRQEFFERKGPRGRATVVNQSKGAGYFDFHDRNEVEDRPDADLIRESRDLTVVQKLRDDDGILFHVDVVSHNAEELLIRGWSFDPLGRKLSDVRFRSGKRMMPTNFRRFARPDVAKKLSNAPQEAGLAIAISLFDITVNASDDPLELQIDYEGFGKTVQISLDKSVLTAIRAANVAVPDVPSMPQESVAALRDALSLSTVYLEYGTGGSTLLATQFPLTAAIAVESDPHWSAAVRRKVSERPGRRFHFLSPDLGPTKEWGYPVGETHIRNWHDYPLGAWRHMAASGLSPDLILIDGRFRRACFLASLVHAKPGTRILFDDYLDRPHYHSVERFLKPERTFDRVAEFVRPQDIDVNAVWTALVEAVMDVR